MIEVRTSYLVRMQDVGEARALLLQLREKVWPVLGWQGRLQEMLHGHVQQSLFVWSSQWENLAAWEADMNRLSSCQEYLDWLEEWNKLLIYGDEREVFAFIEPIVPLENTPGKVEVRSAYTVPLGNVAEALALAEQDQRTSWKLKEAAQGQVMLLGKGAESTFLFATMSDSLTAYEQEMSNLGGRGDFGAWWKAWTEAVGFGGSREILHNI